MKTKINTKKALVMFGIVLLFASCGKSYENVIEDIVNTKNNKMLLLRDVNTNKKSIYYMGEPYITAYAGNKNVDDFKYLHIGDTVTVVTVWLYKEQAYANLKYFCPHNSVNVLYPEDSIIARKQQEKFSLLQQKMDFLKQRSSR